MFDLERHPYFTKWTDPTSGVESFVLTERVAPLQKTCYYLTPGIAAGGRTLWFYAAFPPSRQWHLASVCLDPDAPAIRWYPNAPLGGNPLILPDGETAFVPVGDGIYRMNVEGDTEQIMRMPGEVLQNRHLFSLLTDLTVSADGKHFVLDSHIGNRWLLSLVEVATGELTPLRWFDVCHHHAIFSPTDPELILLGKGPWRDPITGHKGDMNIRIWLTDRQQTRYEPLFGDLWFNHGSQSCHEWWTPDGLVNWCEYAEGVYETDVHAEPRSRELIWPRPLIHAHCSRDRGLYCGDYDPYHWSAKKPCSVWFYDRAQQREIAIAAELPEPPIEPGLWRTYHTDPHPHFTPDDEYVCYATTVLGNLNVAVAPVAGIRERLG